MEDISFQGRKPSGLRKKLLFIIGMVVVVVAVFVVKGQRQVSNPSQNGPENRSAESHRSGQMATEKPSPPGQPQDAALPRLVDLGADKCVPCKIMAPILEELKVEYRAKFEVIVIDVRKNPEAGQKWRIRVIPTQIFFDASGKELFRHEGFFSKEDILKKWEQLGVDVEERVSLKEKPNPAVELASMRAC